MRPLALNEALQTPDWEAARKFARRRVRWAWILSPTPVRLLMRRVVVGDDKTFWHLLDSPQSPNSGLTPLPDKWLPVSKPLGMSLDEENLVS